MPTDRPAAGITRPDWNKVGPEILVAWRQKHRLSQRGLSRRLGFKTNRVHGWETGVRHIKARDLFLVAENLEAGFIVTCLTKFFGSTPTWLKNQDLSPDLVITNLLGDLRAEHNIEQIAARMDISRFKISRWLSGATSPSFSELTRYIDILAGRGIDLISSIIDPSQLNSVSSAWQQLQKFVPSVITPGLFH